MAIWWPVSDRYKQHLLFRRVCLIALLFISTFFIVQQQLMDRFQKFQYIDQELQSSDLIWSDMNQLSFFYNPYLQMVHFYSFQQDLSKKDNAKTVKDFAVQTQKSYTLHPQAQSSYKSSPSQQPDLMKQFPLPNREKLFQLFQTTSTKKKDINQIISELCSEKTKILNGFYKSIGEKIINFKKTKEEIIKFLVRRAWKKQSSGPDQAREKYYAEYKSMNSEYLSVIFKQPRFVAAYEQMLRGFDSEFDAFNQHRFNRFYDYLLHCYVNNNLTVFKTSKECKSKLPYPVQWKNYIYETAQNLYDTYNHKSQQRDRISQVKDHRENIEQNRKEQVRQN